MAQTWYYFGCHRCSGHYLFKPGMVEAGRHAWPAYTQFDAALPPRPKGGGQPLYRATVTRLLAHGMSALSFWDRSVDQRGNSHSTFFVDDLDLTPEALLAGAQRHFPEVFQRLPQPVTWWETPVRVHAR